MFTSTFTSLFLTHVSVLYFCHHWIYTGRIGITLKSSEEKQEQTEVIPHLIILYFVTSKHQLHYTLPFNW